MSPSKESFHWKLFALDLPIEEVRSLETVLRSIKKEDTKKLSLFCSTLTLFKVICISFSADIWALPFGKLASWINSPINSTQNRTTDSTCISTSVDKIVSKHFLFKVSTKKKTLEKRGEICPKLTINTLVQCYWPRFFIEHISNLSLMFLLLSLNK